MYIKWFLPAVVLVGFGLRVYHIDTQPVSMYWDETAMAYDAYALTQTGHDMHGNPGFQAIFPSYGDYKLPMYIWLSALIIKIIGPSVAALRLASVLAGTGLIAAVYALGKSMFKSKVVGLFAATVVAFSPWAIQFSRAGFEANIAVLMVILAVLGLYASIKQPRYLILSGLAAAAGVYSYFSVRWVIPVITLGFAGCYFRDWPKNYLRWLMSGSLLFVLLLIPIFQSPYYALSNQLRLSTDSLLNTSTQVLDQNKLRELAGNTLVSRIIYHRRWLLMNRLAENLATHLDWRYLFFYGDQNLRHGTGQVGLFLWPMTGCFLLGWLVLFRRQKRAGLMLAIWWLAALIPASIPLVVPHALRSLNALPALALVLGYGLAVLWQSRYHLGKWLVIGILAGSSFQFLAYRHDYRYHYPIRSAEAWQSGNTQLALYLKAIQTDYSNIYVTPADRLYLYLLFFMKIPPIETQKQPDQLQPDQFANINMQTVNEALFYQLPEGSLVVLSPDQYNQYQGKPPIVTTINDAGGTPQFILIKKS